jgi:hypothetical protein
MGLMCGERIEVVVRIRLGSVAACSCWSLHLPEQDGVEGGAYPLHHRHELRRAHAVRL